MRGLLEGIRILDLSRVMTGPYCSMMLADLGAEVLKIERPDRGDDTRAWGPPFLGGESAYFLSINRNKKSVTLDVKREEGRAIALELARRSDVFLENFSPGIAAGLGLGYSDVSRANPGIVYCSISGYGQEGPYRDWPAYDLILQGMGGLQGVTGESGRPPVRIGVAVADIAGGMFAAFAIVAALLRRGRTGRGERIDVSLFDSQLAWLTYMAGSYFATGRDPDRLGSKHPTIVPYESFATVDGYINVAAGNDDIFERLCKAVDRPEWARDPRFVSNPQRVENRGELEAGFAAAFAKRTTAEWLSVLRKHQVPAGPVYAIHEIAEDPQVHARGMILALDHPTAGRIRQFGIPFQTSGGQITHTPPPTLGEHTGEVLASIGYDSARIEELRRAKIV